MAKLVWPGPSDRVIVVGRTGSGKTVAGAWHLSGKDFTQQPWVVLNTKGDPLLNEIATIQGVRTIDISETPTEPGLYIVNPRPDEGVEIDAFLGRIWARQNCGVYCDELYMIDEVDNLNAILTQGRSRNIPFIGLSQRPAWVTKFVFSEADFVQLFNLQIEDDRKKMGSLLPLSRLTTQQRRVENNARGYDYRLREHHSYWYNVKQDILVELAPVPAPDQIVKAFRVKFAPKQTPEVKQGPDFVEETPSKRQVRLL